MRLSVYKNSLDVLKLSLPIIGTNVIGALLGVISMYLIAKLGHQYLASGAIISSTYGFLMTIFAGFLYVVGILVSQYQGMKKYNEMANILYAGLIVSTLFGLLLMLIMRHISFVFVWFGQPLK